MGLIRLILAITVVLGHSDSIFGFSFVGGQNAVQAFYIISGFYMALILNEKYIGSNKSYKLFITNRLLRIYPIYWTILLLTIICSISFYFYSNANNHIGIGIYIDYFKVMSFGSFIFLLFTNLFLFFQDLVMFLGLDVTSGNLFFTPNFEETNPMLWHFLFIPQAWTIGVEVAFYLIAPFIVRKKLNFILGLLILSLILRLVLYHYGFKYDPWSYRFFPTELAFFLIGVVSYHLYIRLRLIEIKILYLKIILIVILSFTIFYNFLPLLGKKYIYLLMFFISLPFVFILTKDWKRDSYLGELSYPIYISHIFVLTVMTAFKIPIFGNLGLCLSILTILFSMVLNKFISKRIERIRQKRIS